MILEFLGGLFESLLELLCDIGWLFEWGSSKRTKDEKPAADARPQYPDLEPRQ